MLEVWLPLLVCMALGAMWYHVLRLRERAVAHARELCERHGLQLLDDSVALNRLHLKRRRGGLQVLREYRFDTSLGGHDRQRATITLLDNRIVGMRLPTRDTLEPTTVVNIPVPYGSMAPQMAPDANNVVPITRARRTLH